MDDENTFWVCSDCLDAIEFTDHDLGYEPGTLNSQWKRVNKAHPFTEFSLVSTGSDRVQDFSASWCELCDSNLAGARYEYLNLTPPTEG